MITSDFIKELIQGLSFTETINLMTVDPIANETQIETCITHHIFVDYMVTIDGTQYKVIDYEPNAFFTVKGQVPGTPTEWSIPAPFFFRGTPMQTGSALRMEKQWRKKLPFWYLLEPYTEQESDNPKEKIGTIPRMTLFILFPIGPNEKEVDDHYNELVPAARNAIDDFRYELTRHPKVAKLPELYKFQTKTRVNFGVFVTQAGQGRKKSKEDNVQLMFDEYVTGIEIMINVPLKSEYCTPIKACK